MKTTRDEIQSKLTTIALECSSTEPNIAITLFSLCGAITCGEEAKFAEFAHSHAEKMLAKFAAKRN